MATLSSMSIINSQTVKELYAIDPMFSEIEGRYGLPPDWSRPEGFETLCRIILEQQVSLESAYSAYRKLGEALGEFRPGRLLELPDELMRACYVSRQKTRYLRALSKAVLEGSLDLENLRQKPEEEARTDLTAIVGIGQWTSDVYLMFCLQSPDIFPPGDIAAVNSTKLLKGLEDKESVVNASEQWSPFRTAATFFLWHDYLSRRGRKVDY